MEFSEFLFQKFWETDNFFIGNFVEFYFFFRKSNKRNKKSIFFNCSKDIKLTAVLVWGCQILLKGSQVKSSKESLRNM